MEPGADPPEAQPVPPDVSVDAQTPVPPAASEEPGIVATAAEAPQGSEGPGEPTPLISGPGSTAQDLPSEPQSAKIAGEPEADSNAPTSASGNGSAAAAPSPGGYEEGELVISNDMVNEQHLALAVPFNPQATWAPPPRKAPPPPKAPILPAAWVQPTVPIIEEVEVDMDEEASNAYSKDESEMASLMERASTMESNAILDEEPVTLSRLVEFLAVSEGLRKSCRSLPLTISLWVIFMLLLANHANTSDSFAAAHALEDATWQTSATVTNSRGSLQDLDLWKVSETQDILNWIQYGFVGIFDDKQRVRDRQQLIGSVRLTQVRGANASCELNTELARFHGGWCHPAGGDPQDYGPSALDYAFRPRHDDGEAFKAWLDMARGDQSIQRRLDLLRRDGWLDVNTQSMAVEALFLNPEERIYSFLSLTFRIHRGGWIEQDLRVTPLRADVWPYWFHIFLDMLWCWLLFVLGLKVGREFWKARKENMLKLYWQDPYNWLDWASLIIGTMLILFFWGLSRFLDDFTGDVANVGAMPDQAWYEVFGPTQVQTVSENLEWHNKVNSLLARFELVTWYVIRHRLVAWWYSLLILLRFFRGFTGQPRIAILIQTTWTAADFLTHYLVVFLIVIATFAVSGHILFGEHRKEFSNLGSSFCRLFQIILSYADYKHSEMHNDAPFSAGCWFVAFYISAMLLMIGVFTVGILHQYMNVKERLGESGVSLWQQARDYFTEFWWSETYDGSQKTAPDHVLLKAFSQGLTPEELQRLGRYKLDRRLRTRADVLAHEKDLEVSAESLIKQGCDKVSARRLINRVRRAGHHVGLRSTPANRAMLQAIRHMGHMHREAEKVRLRLDAEAKWCVTSIDRMDLKHAKCAVVARRIRSAQVLPEGWSEHYDEEGRKYLKEEASGLTAWTLPRGMFG
mmetsp:Transcript_36238/g.85021  ORF Transcript_36238/g.85021 Transcript_36238/m.85021 type:complete len:914 (+) Transcript_36238:133-2874(+)